MIVFVYQEEGASSASTVPAVKEGAGVAGSRYTVALT